MSNPNELYEINPEHGILHVTLKGSWGEETTQEFATSYKQIVSRYFAREWACSLDLRQLDMLVSEEFQIHSFVALNTWSFIKGMHAMAIIVDDHNRGHLLYQFEEIVASSPSFKTNVFADMGSATEWLNEEGFRGKEEFSFVSRAMLG